MQEKKKLVKQAGDATAEKQPETWNDQKVKSYIRYLYQQNERLWQAVQQLQDQVSALTVITDANSVYWTVRA